MVMFTLHLLHTELNWTKDVIDGDVHIASIAHWTEFNKRKRIKTVDLFHLPSNIRDSYTVLIEERFAHFNFWLYFFDGEGTGMTNTFCYSFLTANGI